MTREACYEFVRSGCKPRESFRYARTAAAADADAGRADAGREGSAVFASGVWARARMRVRDCDRRTERPRRWDARRGGRERDDDDARDAMDDRPNDRLT